MGRAHPKPAARTCVVCILSQRAAPSRVLHLPAAEMVILSVTAVGTKGPFRGAAYSPAFLACRGGFCLVMCL